MESLKSVVGLGGASKDDEHERQEPVSGAMGAGTVDQPYDAGNLEQETAPDNTTTKAAPPPPSSVTNEQHSPHTSSENTAAISTAANTTTLANGTTAPSSQETKQDPPEKINSLFNNPFAKRPSISGASKDVPLDPKAQPEPGEEPLPELDLVESAVTIHEPKPVRNPFAPSARQPDMARHNSKDKGKARAAAGYYQGIINQRPSYQQQYSQADSGSSTISRRSDSNATHSTGTDPTTLGSSAAGRRPSYVPSSQQNPGRIPTAGGRPIGQNLTGYVPEEPRDEPGPSIPRALREQLNQPLSAGAPQFNQQEYLEAKRAQSGYPPSNAAPAGGDDRGDSISHGPPRRKSSIFGRFGKGTGGAGQDKSTSSSGGGVFRSLSRRFKK